MPIHHTHRSIAITIRASRPTTGLGKTAVAILVTLLTSLPAAAATLVVDDDGTYDSTSETCDGGDIAYTVIQTAIGDAVDGDTILVCPGTYNESQIVVNKRVTVQGSGAATTIIDGGGSFGNPTWGTVRLVPVAGTGDVVFDGFTLQNPRATTSETALRVGIFAASPVDVNITVTNNVIVGSGNPTYGSDYGVYAAGPISGQPAIDTFVFQHNEVRGHGSNSILIERHAGPTDVSYNTLDRGVRSGTITTYVNMSHSGTVITSLQRVSHNTIDMANDPGPYDITNASTGIGFIGGLTGSNVGNFTNVEITHNTIYNLESFRRGIALSNNIATLANTANGTIANAVISCNEISGPASSPQAGSVGIRIIGNIPSPSISNNAISSVDVGFRAENVTNGVASGVVLRENAFVDTDTYAVDWRSTEVIDAEFNWWDSDTGPTDPANPGGTGGIIGAGGGLIGSGVIDFSPWLASGVDGDAGPCFIPGGAAECRTVGTCDEVDGCSDDPAPDGTICGGGSFTCSAGACNTALSPMVLRLAKLKADSGRARPNGRVSVTGLVNDNDTQGGLEAALLGNSVTIDVQDSADFAVVRSLTNCVAKRSVISCRSADRLTRASFRFRPVGPYLYTMRLSLKGIPQTETGASIPVGPVTVAVGQDPGTRTDVIGDFAACTPRGALQLSCRER